jgi:hypothetical protein
MAELNKEKESNFWIRIKRFVKKHPAMTAGIVGLIIGGAIATGGILLLPAAAGVISTAGMWIGMAATATAVAAMTRWAGCCGGKAGVARSVVSILATCASIIGPIALVTIFPIAGVVLAGIAAVTAIAGLFAVCGRWINHCLKPPAPPLDLHPQFVAVGNSYKYLPPDLAPKVSLKTKLDAVSDKALESGRVANTGRLSTTLTKPATTVDVADRQISRQRKVS